MKNKTLLSLITLVILVLVGFFSWYFVGSNTYISHLIIGNEVNNARMVSNKQESQVACVKDSDCVTPGEYLMRSNCPYTSICVENKCVVVCPDQAIDYKNSDYGFNLSLPLNWRGYSVVTESWLGNFIDEPNKPALTGPKIIIRHPLWTNETPRQDIPVLIFTTEEWSLIQQEKISLGAAPIGPSKLGQNDKYIFAIPARYNFAYPVGFEEVEDIIKNNESK
jgi:hypothetical protein